MRRCSNRSTHMRATRVKRGKGERGKGKRITGKGQGQGERKEGFDMARTTHKGNGHHARHVTETPDVSHIKNPDVTHEASDVDIAAVAKFVVGLTVLGIVVFVLMWGMFDFLNAQEEEKAPKAGPMAMNAQEGLAAGP